VPEREPFAYALLRIIPDADRGEAVNAGVVLFCRGRDFLAVHSVVPTEKLTALRANIDVEAVINHLRALELIAAGDPAGGPMAAGQPSARFHWLVAPSSTIVQPSQVHTGLCDDPARTLRKLFDQLVA